MDDLISRKMAIDAVIKRDANCGIDSAEVLRSLPSAQSEIVHCKDCRWKNKHFCNRAVELFIHDEDFCSWGKRREG